MFFTLINKFSEWVFCPHLAQRWSRGFFMFFTSWYPYALTDFKTFDLFNKWQSLFFFDSLKLLSVSFWHGPHSFWDLIYLPEYSWISIPDPVLETDIFCEKHNGKRFCPAFDSGEVLRPNSGALTEGRQVPWTGRQHLESYWLGQRLPTHYKICPVNCTRCVL